MSEYVAPEHVPGSERHEWLGLNQGSITITNTATGNQYRVALNFDDRFPWIRKEDLDWAATVAQLRPAPLEEKASSPPAVVGEVGADQVVEGPHWAEDVEGLTPQAVQALRDSAIPDLETALAMDDAALLQIDGVGPATVKALRKAGETV